MWIYSAQRRRGWRKKAGKAQRGSTGRHSAARRKSPRFPPLPSQSLPTKKGRQTAWRRLSWPSGPPESRIGRKQFSAERTVRRKSLAAKLTARDIPTLYLGRLLERPEVKDLLCLLSLLSGQDGSALLRVAAWPEYAVPQADTLALLAQLGQTPMVSALQDAESEGLRRLGAHLAELKTQEDDPAALLLFYLFGQSAYLRHLQAHEPKPFLQIQQGLAIHQLLDLAATFDQRPLSPGGQEAVSPNRVHAFLTQLRRMSAAGETLRGTVPAEAEFPDAVRVLTVHAAKGLEYPVVFVPNLGAGQFPARGRQDGIPEPPGLADAAGQETDEEDCLFFVALSRARDHIILSRAETSDTDRAIQPSPLLTWLQPWFMARGVAETRWPSGRVPPAAEDSLPRSVPPGILPTYTASALELYGRCPRQYYYERLLKLTGMQALGGYPQFHASIRQALDWLDEQQAAGRDCAGEALTRKLDEVWAVSGPVGHLHEGKYKDAAHEMLRVAAEADKTGEMRLENGTLEAVLSSCRVRVRPDVLRLDTADGSLIAARQMTGKAGDDDKNDKRLALYRRAAWKTHPERPLRLELHYLSDGTVTTVEPPATDYKEKLEADRVNKYEAAAQGIQAGVFPARPGDVCRGCAYALLCPL